MAVRIGSGGLQSVANGGFNQGSSTAQGSTSSGGGQAGGGGTSEARFSPEKAEALRKNCIARGGTWDEATQTCRIPEEVAKQAAEDKPQAGQAEALVNPETGRASGITLPDGRTFFGLTPEDVQFIQQEQAARVAGAAPSAERQLTDVNQGEIAAFGEAVAAQEEPLTEVQQEFLAEQELAQIQKQIQEALARGDVDTLNRVAAGELQFTSDELKTLNDFYNVPVSEFAKAKNIQETEAFFNSVIVQRGLRFGGGIDVFGLSVDDTIDAITNRQDADAIQSSLGKIGTIASTIKGTRDAGGLSTEEAIAELRSLETDLAILELRIKQAAILDPEVKASGKYYDIVQDINDQRTSVREAVADVLATEAIFNPAEIAILTKQFEEQTNTNKERILKGLE